ncbi:unnamed protein product [Adineta steineri]|uniref:Uncharacterized protein n=1 Tax=Adineta steineri TaxID=433720 RepID=A0A815L7U3_9BILA|nr:unnamed protein product [Adineta steineri]CAF1403368.1 unnamed protein product [Adineta steineri]
MSIKIRIRSLFTKLKKLLQELNLFNSGSNDVVKIKNEKRSTRLYLILLIISTIILTFYYCIIPFLNTVIILSPSFIEYSALIKYPTLKCPCSNIVIEYNKFLEIEPLYHELCQSDLVSDKWINHLFTLYEEGWINSNPSDFRRTGAFQFQTLSSLCQLAKNSMENNLESFQSTEFIQIELISEQSFHATINSFIKDFIDMTPKTFVRTLRLIQDITAQNLFMTGASMTSLIPFIGGDITTAFSLYVGINYTSPDGFTCGCSGSTATTCMILTTFQNKTIPGFQTGCYMLSALLQSTLEAFYNQTFIDSFTNSSEIIVNHLNSSNSNWTIETLLNQMFVAQWLNTTSYERYFNSCAPDQCQYTITQYYNFIQVVTLVIGLFGGLTSILRIITPIIIMYICPFFWKLIKRRRIRVAHNLHAEIIERVSISNRIMKLFQTIKRLILQMNLFAKIPPSEDEQVLRQERYISRLYLILFLICLSICILFTSIRSEPVSVTVDSPSVTTAIELYNRYPFTLNCPCTRSTMKYNEFITDLKAEFHEICLSEYVEIFDFRFQSPYMFQLLSTLCSIANKTVEDSLESFYLTELFTNELINVESFQTQIDFAVTQFNQTLPDLFQIIIQLTKDNFEINQFISTMNSNVSFESGYSENQPRVIFFPVSFQVPTYNENNCSSMPDDLKMIRCYCTLFSTHDCYTQTTISSGNNSYHVTGMVSSWNHYQSLLMSTLECFYNEECLGHLIQMVDSTNISTSDFILRQPSSFSQIHTEYKTIENLVNDIFIYSWKYNTSYLSYFEQCQPLQCHYTYQSRINLIYIITTIFGLIGGLNIILRLTTPIIFKLALKIWHIARRQRNNVTVATSVSVPIRTGILIRYLSIMKSMKSYIINLDVFPTLPPTNDPKIIRINRYKTRIYLVLLITALIILVLYASLTQNIITNTIKSPSMSQFTALYAQYPSTLQCPCSRPTIKYNKFFSRLEPQYHEICSSTFVMSQWIENLQNPYEYRYTFTIDTLIIDSNDFRFALAMQFQMLSVLCDTAQTTINQSISKFQETDFITLQAIPIAEFNARTQILFNEWKSTKSNQFIETLQFLQLVNLANQLATVENYDWEFFLRNDTDPHPVLSVVKGVLDMITVPQTYGVDNCSCALKSTCSNLAIYSYPISNRLLTETIPGFRIGCRSLDAMLQSSLSCLYNETCLVLMQAAISYAKPIPVKTLSSSPSFWPPNTTIEVMLDELFVTNWLYETSFEKYFDECAPQLCQYSYTMRFYRIYIVTTLFALFGGLTKGLHIAISFIAFVILKLLNCRKKKHTIVPDIQRLDISVVDEDNKKNDEVSHVSTEFQPVPIQVDVENVKRRKEQLFLIGLFLLTVTAIVVVFIVWFLGRNKEYQPISITLPRTEMTSLATIESTTPLTTDCYMTFKSESQTYPTGRHPMSLTIGDFNRDSYPDLAVTNFEDHTISVMLGNETGTFQFQQILLTGDLSYPLGIVNADLNNDTLLDLAVTLSGANQIAIFYGINTNALFNNQPYRFAFDSRSNKPGAIEVYDADNNGFLDLAVGSAQKVNLSEYLDPHAVIGPLLKRKLYDVFKNPGNGSGFISVCANPCQLWSSNAIAFAVGDFVNGGKQNDLSILSSNSDVTMFSSITFTKRGYGEPWSVNSVYEYPSTIIKGRFNDDNFDDLALISPSSDTLQILLAYDEYFIQQIYLTNAYPTSIARINFNNDQIDDIAVLHCNRTVSVFLGSTIGLFSRSPFTVHINGQNNGECAQSLKVADFNQDGRDDLVFIDTGTNNIRVLLGTRCNR